LKIFLYQDTPVTENIATNIQTIRQAIVGASTLGATVAVFPELFVTGYNIGDNIKNYAEPITGSFITTLSSIAKQHNIAIICGFPEQTHNAVFNSAVAINRSGNVVGHHRKVFLFGDQEKTMFTSGNQFTTFDLDDVCCGLSICYDIEFPETTRDMVRQGAKVIFNPTANMQPYSEVPLTLARARALENGIVVVYANLCGEENGLSYTGLSAIIGPDGKDLARAGDGPTILFCSINPKNLASNNVFSTQLTDLASSSYLGR
jgi:5-aminopentanamidase